MHAISISIAVFLFTVLLWLCRRTRNNPKRLPFPPGPSSFLIIGNTQDLSKPYIWLDFAEWSKKYGDLIHLRVLGQDYIILNSVNVVNDLMEKDSAIYSDRPVLPMLLDLIGFSFSFGFGPSDNRWRRHRRIFHEYFRLEKIAKYQTSQLLEARRLLKRLLVDPEGFDHHIKQVFTGTVLNTLYGLDLKDPYDPYVEIGENAMSGFSVAGFPGKFLVDIIPALKYVPEWFPGAGFKKTARHFKEFLPPLINKPFDDMMGRVLTGKAKPCVVLDALETWVGEDPDKDYETDIKQVAATAFAGGSDTTRSTIALLFLTLMLHLEVQREAQEQLDRVVRKDRLPEFDDIEQCPLVRAIVMELIRWQPLLPLMTAHRSTEDSEYRGYFIPKGSLMLGNAWAILHDEVTYPDPHAFRPERFLHADGMFNWDVQSPEVAAFGYGCRICPGRH